jgi:hypothetical protein
VWDLIFVPFLGHIEVAVAAPVLFDIFLTVYAWTDDIFVSLSVYCREPAWTAHITVTLFVFSATLDVSTLK